MVKLVDQGFWLAVAMMLALNLATILILAGKWLD